MYLDKHGNHNYYISDRKLLLNINVIPTGTLREYGHPVYPKFYLQAGFHCSQFCAQISLSPVILIVK